MVLFRRLLPTLVTFGLCAASVSAQSTGTIRGRVVDSASSLALANVAISVEGTSRATSARPDGTYELTGVPSGPQRVRARRIGYAGHTLDVNVPAGGTVIADFMLVTQALALTEVVVTGYGTTRREAITGSVATLNADEANKGVIANATQLMQGRVAGVEIVQNNGEPGAGAQVRIRGGTSINASNNQIGRAHV